MNRQEAVQLARDTPCLVCYFPSSEVCHWPRHRGSGGRFENDWAPEVWVPLCHYHHDLVDGRQGVSEAKEYERWLAVRTIEERRADRP